MNEGTCIRVFEIGNARLYHGDCLDVMPLLAGIDHLMMDAPYEAHMHAALSGDGLKRTDGYNDTTDLDFEDVSEIRAPFALAAAKLRPRWFITFCTTEGVAAWRDAIEAAGMRYHCAGIWHKTDARPRFNGQGPAIGHECFVTAWGASGVKRWNGGGHHSFYHGPTQSSTRTGLHPTEKPVWLMEAMVRDYTNRGDLICDPFMGSGTTGVAALRLGRRFIGIEKNEAYFEAACKRLADAVRQGGDLIDEAEAMPKRQGKLGDWPRQKKGCAA